MASPIPVQAARAGRPAGKALVIQFMLTSGDLLAKVRYQLSAGGQMLRKTIIQAGGRDKAHREVYDEQ